MYRNKHSVFYISFIYTFCMVYLSVLYSSAVAIRTKFQTDGVLCYYDRITLPGVSHFDWQEQRSMSLEKIYN